MARSEDVKTPLARFAFTQHLFKPQKDEKSGRENFNCTLLFPKGSDLSVLESAALEAAKLEWGDKAVEMIKAEVIKTPFLDGDGKQGRSKETGEPHPGFPGHRFIRVKSGVEYKPKIFDQRRNPIMSPEDFYSGVYGYAVVNAFTWENKEQGKGITFGVSLIQKAKDGDRLGGVGGGADPDKWLEKIADEGDAPEETKGGKGAEGLFG